MKKNLILSIFLIIFLVISVYQVSAFMPKNSHKIIFSKALDTEQNSEIYKICKKYQKLCYSGNVLADVSVIWYWTRGEKYDVTHSPNFCRGLIEESRSEEEYACAIGACLHQASDIVSHNELVPDAIRNTKLVNYIIHVFAEQKVDNWVEKNYPGTDLESLNYLADYSKCIPLFKRVMKGNNEYSDITDEEFENIFSKFILEIKNSKTGYDPSFQKKSFFVNIKSLPFSLVAIYILLMSFFTFIFILLIIKLIRGESMIRHYIALIIFGFVSIIFIYFFVVNLQGKVFENFISFIKPVSNFVPLKDSEEYYITKAIDYSKNFLANGELWLSNMGSDGKLASGREALDNADRSVASFTYLLALLLILFLIVYITYLFKSNKIKDVSIIEGL